MYLTRLEMEQVAGAVRHVTPKPDWDVKAGWPPSGVVWRVYPVPVEATGALARGMTPDLVCRQLRTTYDATEDALWCFVPGDIYGEIWLVRPDQDPGNHPLS